MIEYALLFGLGFLAAAFLAMLVAPAIQRRIVVYAENRLKATMPLSPQEVRAQRDLARAAFAAEQSRTQQELAIEREKRVNLQVSNELASREAARLHAANADLKVQIEDMSVEAADLRSALRQSEGNIAQLQEKLSTLEVDISERNLEIEELRKQNHRFAADRDNLKIDLAARNAQLENDRYRLQSLREERDGLRREVKLVTARAREAEQRLEQEEHKALKLADRLEREKAGVADKENLIERRALEIQRLREKIKTISQETREARKALKSPPADRRTGRKGDQPPVLKLASVNETLPLTPERLPEIKEAVRHQTAELSDQLMRARAGTEDAQSEAALREELASVAAQMVAITAMEEGANSPIYGILDNAETREGGPEPSLAERLRGLLPRQETTL